ncbi:hypothetical protein SO802_006006 [Lithocarpus litseifolius]|uniref:DUF7746 domain-containing protein n=1 Tax=Lithocarpus litseifolius TaxID=425828 RepID=A0AAW2DMT3_9ROSI
MGKALLIQTNVNTKIQVPKTLKWSKVRTPLDEYRPRSLIDLRQSDLPSRQPPILLRDRLASPASSSRPLTPYPRSRRNLGVELQGVKTRSQEILNKIQHMTMVANSYLDEGRPHKEVIELIALGFTGKLLQWWNNYLTEGSKDDIKHAIQKDEECLLIFDEHLEKGNLDGVNTLIYTIMKHFVGKPSNITSRIYDQLSNLRCQTLGDYRWYEDVFTTRVMHRNDCNSPIWKEKFINGLLRLFGEKLVKPQTYTTRLLYFPNSINFGYNSLKQNYAE